VAATLSDVGPSSAARAQRARKRKSLKDTNKGDTKLTGTLRACQSLLRILMDHKHAWPFNQPVDPVSLQILDYFDIIKNPMDFSTIKEQLEDGIYDAPEEFATDIRLVFKNAFTYNQAGSDICVMAENLQNLFEKKFAKLGKRTEEDGMESTINEIRDSMKYVREEIRKLKETKRGAPAAEVTKRGRPPAQEDERPMTLDEKRALSIGINSLPSLHLGKVIQIINDRMPNLTSSSTPGEIEIDIDALDAGTLRALERFVKSCIHKKSKKKSTPTIPPVPLAETGTTKRIRDVERQLKEITEKSQALNRSKGGTVKPDNMEVDSTNPPVQETKKEESSSSDSDSSDSSSSDTESGSSDSSGTESESEKKKKEVQTETPIITSTMMDIIEPPAPLPSVPNEAAPKILSSAPAVKKVN